MQAVTIGNVACGGDAPLLLITGPCQIESADHALYCAEALAKMAATAGMQIGHLLVRQGELVWITGLKFWPWLRPRLGCRS